jgi:hypothetical protein
VKNWNRCGVSFFFLSSFSTSWNQVASCNRCEIWIIDYFINISMVKTSTFPWWENLVLSHTKCHRRWITQLRNDRIHYFPLLISFLHFSFLWYYIFLNKLSFSFNFITDIKLHQCKDIQSKFHILLFYRFFPLHFLYNHEHT